MRARSEANGSSSVQEILREAQVEEVLEALESALVALRPVKQRIREIAALLVVDKLRRRAGLTSTRPTLHMCFTGNGRAADGRPAAPAGVPGAQPACRGDAR
jgi:hypothetical protein